MLTNNDIEYIITLGYIVDIPTELAISQLNQHFPGITLVILLNQIGELLDSHADEPIYRRLVIDETPEPRFEIIYRSSNPHDPKNGLILSRVFYYQDENLVVKHNHFSLPEKSRMKGLGRQILAIFYDQYVTMGVKHIYLTAGLKDGGAVWAKMGFNALYKHQMQDILASAEEVFAGKGDWEDAKAIFDAYYDKAPKGKSFPIRQWADMETMELVLKNTNWDGWLDLTNPEELTNFKLNVGR